MKFDFCIGNPPYQETQESTSDNPVYNDFMDAAYEISDKTLLITPARFLFNAGKTPKVWNQKMLEDTHFKVKHYEKISSKIFTNTDIKGGIAITYYDNSEEHEAIQIFTPSGELNSILHKVIKANFKTMSDLVYSPESYKFTEKMHDDHPEIKQILSNGHAYDLTSNIFDKLEGIVFFREKPNDTNDYIQIFGRQNNERTSMWINKKYIAQHPNLDKYKLFYSKSNGAGRFGEVITLPEVSYPHIGHTQTFISMGTFDTEIEVKNLYKYLKSKFQRALLGVLKVTQDNKKSVWKYVPLQDFTDSSDIDWSVSITDIDKQLYKKYNLSDDEINFIESNVKEME